MQRMIRGFYSRVSPLRPLKLTASKKKQMMEDHKATYNINATSKPSLKDWFFRRDNLPKASAPTTPAAAEEVRTNWGAYYDDFAWMQ
jgi:hypothetical protein